MKFDKKVRESGMVAAFTLVMTLTSICSTNVTTQLPNTQVVALTTETLKKKGAIEKATKKKIEKNVVAASIAENKPEQKIEDVQKEVSKKETSAKKEEIVEEKEISLKTSEKEEKASEEKVSEEKTSEEKTSEEEKASEEKTSEEKVSEEEKASEEKTSEEEKASEEKASEEKVVKDSLLETGSEERSPWASKLLPDVEDYLNIRLEPSDEAELAGKLHKGAMAEIIEKGDEWTKISSGSVEGYVKNEFCITGLEAESLANQVGTTYATAITGGVRVRENASSSEDTVIVDVLEEGGKIKVDTQAEKIEGWIAVKIEDATAYVSADYVNVELELGKAISIEEERAAIAAAEAEKARKEQEQRQAQEQEQAQASSAATSQKETVAASYDDVTLLGALIQCEAGGEPYEGKLAVGAVVINRLRAGYAGSISGVIYQGGQFTPASSGALSSVLSSGVNGSCIQAAQEAINGVDNVGGATSFRRASSGISGIVIGNHVFF